MDFNPIENANSDHFVPTENWSNLNYVTIFEKFVQCDWELKTCSLLPIDVTNDETSLEEGIIALKSLYQIFHKLWGDLTLCKNTSLAGIKMIKLKWQLKICAQCFVFVCVCVCIP